MLIETLKQLVSFKTISSDKSTNKEALDWFKSQIPVEVLVVTEFESNGYYSLVLTTKKTKSPRIWLGGHIDVVPASEAAFEMQEKEGKLYGRGVYDMKYALACYVNLLNELKDSISEYDLGVMITSDEEIGGTNGVGALVKQGYSGDVIVLPDGGANWEMERSAKGILQLKIESTGESAHGSRTWLGNNAIEQLFAFYQEVKKLFPQEPCDDPKHYHSTVNLGTISGGEATNKIPDYAAAGLDIRYIPEYDKTKILKDLEKIHTEFPGIKVIETASGAALKVDTNNPYIASFLDIVTSKGTTPTFGDSHGASDARFFAEIGVPTIIISPPGGGHHGENEWIERSGVETYYEILKEFVQKNAKK